MIDRFRLHHHRFRLRACVSGNPFAPRGMPWPLALALVLTLSVIPGTGAQDAPDPCTPYSATPTGSEGAGGSGDAHAGHHRREGTPGASPAAELPQLDLAFIDLMVPHHEGAILMSEIALGRAEHGEIVMLAESIVREQSAEQEQLMAWRAEWFAGSPEYSEAELMAVFDMAMAEMDMAADQGGLEHLDPATDAAALCAVEGSFDMAFIDRMLSHHRAAIDMANVVLVSGEHEELRAFAQNVIAAQQAEIDQMEIWRAEWFGGTPAASFAG